MEKITTNKGNSYYLLYSDRACQRFIACEKYDGRIYDRRDKCVFNCTREELLPLMNRLGF